MPGIVSRNYKPKKILLLPCIYRYIFRFTLELINTLLQKLAIFHIWNVIQKDGGMNQNSLHCCYDEYVTTNQQTKHALVSLHRYHVKYFLEAGQNILFVLGFP